MAERRQGVSILPCYTRCELLFNKEICNIVVEHSFIAMTLTGRNCVNVVRHSGGQLRHYERNSTCNFFSISLPAVGVRALLTTRCFNVEQHIVTDDLDAGRQHVVCRFL